MEKMNKLSQIVHITGHSIIISAIIILIMCNAVPCVNALESGLPSKGNNAISRFMTKRLIVISSSVKDTYGAVAEWESDYKETILEYETEREAEEAYENLKEQYRVYPDVLIAVDTSGESIDTSLGMSGLINTRLSHDVTIAVLDTGINTDDPRFDKVDESGIKQKGGRILSSSYDFVHNTADLTDSEGHGTTVAGIIAENTPENVSILSCTVLKDSSKEPIKVDDESASGRSTLLTIGTALRYAVANGADIINMSLDLEPESGDNSTLNYLNDIIEDAYEDGIICTVAAGNYEKQITLNDYPACLGSAVTVGSVDRNGVLSDFSNYGKMLDFVAPGELDVMEGTSAAAPCIAACFAYLKAAYPEDKASELVEKLRMLCVDLGDMGKDDYYGWGLPDMSGFAPEIEHHYVKEVISRPTCTESGLIRYTCSDEGCTAVYDQSVSKTGHTWKAEQDEAGIRFVCRNIGCGAVLDSDDLEGAAGDGITWRIVFSKNYTDDPVARLEIDGSGAIAEKDTYPWKEFGDHITSLILSDGITAIPSNAFSGMKSLSAISHTDDMEHGRLYSGFPSGLTSIGVKAFFNCDSLKSIMIRAGVTGIGVGAFSGCQDLKNISVEAENRYFKSDGEALYFDRQLLVYIGSGGAIKDNTLTIASYAFFDSDISSIEILESVSGIHERAFGNCFALRSVSFCGNSSILISDSTFDNVNADIYYPEEYEGADWTEKPYAGILRWHQANLTTDNFDVTLSGTEFTYTGEQIRPDAIVQHKESGTVLTEGVDYRLVYSDNVLPGTGEVKVIGTNSGYSGIITKSFKIGKAQFTFRKLSVPEEVNAGEEVEVKYDGKLIKDISELEIHYSSDPEGMFVMEEDSEERKVLVPRKAGTGTLIVTAEGNEFYDADLVKKYIVTVLPCEEDMHEWDDGYLVTAPTYSSEGLKRYVCLRCGATRDETVPHKKGAEIGSIKKIGGLTYKVKGTSSVSLIKANNASTIKVPASVNINGKRYKITSIGSKALYKKSMLRKLIVGSNVRIIGGRACYGCRKLKDISLKGISVSKIGSKAFARISTKASVKVPKKKVKKYRKILKKAGLNGKKQKVKTV